MWDAMKNGLRCGATFDEQVVEVLLLNWMHGMKFGSKREKEMKVCQFFY